MKLNLLQHLHKVLLLFFIVVSINSFAHDASQEKKLLISYKLEKNQTKKFWKLYELSLYYKQYNFTKADSVRESLLNYGLSENDSARYLVKIYDAEIDLLFGDINSYFEKVLTIETSRISSKLKLDHFHRLSSYYVHIRDFYKAKVYINTAIKIARRQRENKSLSKLYALLSQTHTIKNHKDSSYLYAIESIQFARRSADKEVLAEAFNSQAKVFRYFGQIELSVSKCLIAFQLVSELGNHYLIAQYSNYIGEAQLFIQNYKEAELYFLNSIESAGIIKDKRNIALAQVNLGNVYRLKKQFEEAISIENKAIRLLIQYNDENSLGAAHNILGDIYREQKKFSIALSNYNKALVYFESSGNQEQIATVYHNVGFVFEKQGEFQNALKYLNRSLQIRSQFGYKGAMYPTYYTMSEVYSKTGNKTLALHFLKKYADYSDSAKILESNAKIAELSELYRSEQREKFISIQADSIEHQRQEKALTTAKLENVELKSNLQTYIISAFVLIMIFAGIITYSRWRQRSLIQQQQEAEMNQTLLRSQMNPHFVFNAMSVIQSYVYDNDVKNSSKFLVNFSKLMRLILENSSKEFIAIQTEYDILDKYLSIQKLRFEDRFEYTIKVEDELFEEDAEIPPMITQPFIENSIEHGRLHLIKDGFIHIHFYKKGGMLKISIEDNGVGRKGAETNKKSKDHKSMAMKITNDRIELLNKKYKTHGFMKIEDYNPEEGTGTKVLISIPYRIQNQN